jgi:nitroreductase
MDKPAPTDYPIHDLLLERWSPRAFADRPVDDNVLLSLFEAARWAPSSYNAQPWVFFVARRHEFEDFKQALSCLTPPNQEWAEDAAVLVLTAIRTNHEKNGKANRVALHDLGLAVGNLVVEATSHGLAVHQMEGVDLEAVRREYKLPDHYAPQTGIAIGYPGNPTALHGKLREQELGQRKRKPLNEFVFSTEFGAPARILDHVEA